MIEKKFQSFRYSFKGLLIAWREEFNFRLEITLAIIAIFLAWFLGISTTEWLIVTFVIGFVLAAEVLNTALEELCDKFQPTHDPHIAKIKDLGAAAVLVSAMTAFVIGCIIFVPRLLTFFL